MDDIARSLSISKKTLYQHFSNKRNLITQYVDNLTSQFEIQLNLILKQKGIETKEQAVKIGIYILKFYQENFRFFEDLKHTYYTIWKNHHTRQTKTISEIILPIYNKLKKNNQLNQSVNKEVFDFIFLEACRLQGSTIDDSNYQENERQVLKLLLEGLLTMDD